MTLIDQVESAHNSDAKAQRREYREIVEREATGATNPDDVTVLVELLRAMGKTAAEFATDARNLRTYFQAVTNRKAAEGDPQAAKTATAKSREAMEAARLRLVDAQKAFDEASAVFNRDWNYGGRVARALENEMNAKANCVGLLD